MFGADKNKLNSEGLTPYEMVTTNDRLPEAKNLLKKLGAKQSAQLINQAPVSKVPELLDYKTHQLGGSRILCLDGGGIKGLIQLEILLQIEEVTGRSVVELFDWIVGTSTGGVIALALVYGELHYWPPS